MEVLCDELENSSIDLENIDSFSLYPDNGVFSDCTEFNTKEVFSDSPLLPLEEENKTYLDLEPPRAIELDINSCSLSSPPPSSPSHTLEDNFQPDLEALGHNIVSDSGNMDMSSWTKTHPHHWSTTQVLDWVHFVAQSMGMGAQFRGEAFNTLEGADLWIMTEEEFCQRDPINGRVLYHLFQKLSKNSHFSQPAYIEIPSTDDLATANLPCLPEMEPELHGQPPCTYNIGSSAMSPPLHHHQPSASHCAPLLQTQAVKIGEHSYDFDGNDKFHDLGANGIPRTVAPEDEGYDSGDSEKENQLYQSHQMAGMETSDYMECHRDLNYPSHMANMASDCMFNSAPMNSSYLQTPDNDSPVKPPKNKPGRPKKRVSSYDRSTPGFPNQQPANHRGRKPGQAKGNHLWEFIRDLLKNNTTNPKLIKWEDRKDGVFRFVQSEAVAQMWGRKKNNPGMTYEKLSRAMRFCRTAGYFTEVPKNGKFPKKLCFKFGNKAFGWQED